MTVMVGKLTSIGGEPFGGEGHAVNIFSRVTRTSTAEEAVILQLIDRIDMPSVEDGGDGTFTTADMDPGPIRVELEGSSRHGEGWDINLPEPDPEDPRPWSLGSLIGLQVDWDPVVVGRAESAAREATRQADAAEGHAGVAAEHRAHIDEVVYDVLHNAAGMVRDEVKDDADRAETQAGIATEQAGVAAGHAEKAGEDRVQTGADRRQTGEDRAQTGEDREAAEGWASQSKDAATLAITAAATVSQYVGDGFPEGKVAAPVGSIYVDRQATSGAVRWIKTQGTGATGWRMDSGRTGWRILPHSTDNTGLTGEGRIRIMREGQRVALHLDSVPLVAGNGAALVLHHRQIPNGFSPENHIGTILTASASLGSYDYADLRFNTSLWFLSRRNRGAYSTDRTGMVLNGEISWTTNDPWPSTLPGVPS